jgi:hypothetical protein
MKLAAGILCGLVGGIFLSMIGDAPIKDRAIKAAVTEALYLEQVQHHGCKPTHTKGVEDDEATVCVLPDGSVWKRR